MTATNRVALWDAINRVVAASGGNPGNTSVARQRAVVDVERVVAAIKEEAAGALVEALSVLRSIRANIHTLTDEWGRETGDKQRAAVAELERVIVLCSRTLA